jgi:hypothetical protein
MRCGLVCCLAFLAITVPAVADIQIDSAISVFKKTGTDADKLMTFCAMSRTMEAGGDNGDPATKSEIDGYLKQLGPDFEAAWQLFRETDQNAPEGKALSQAVDQLGNQCPD